MKNCTEYLLNLAKRVTKIYTDAEGIKSIAIGASVSKGQATEFSDIDIIMIYDKIPSDEFFDNAFKQNNGTDRQIMNKSESGCLEIYYVDGVECQFSHSLKDFYEHVLTEILEKNSTEPMPHLIADGMQTVIPLYGKDYIDEIKTKFSKYPEELALKITERYFRFGPFDELRYRFQKEDNIIWAKDVISIYVKRLLGTLLGVNRKYIPGDFRKISYVIEKLEHKPKNLYKRILNLYNQSPKDIIEDLFELTKEVFAIVEKYLPEFDISKTKELFFKPQKAFDVKK